MATLVLPTNQGSAVIYTVMSHSPAETAGLQPGDVIVAVGGSPVSSPPHLATMLQEFEPGQTTTISVFRLGKQVDMIVQFAQKPQDA